MSVISELCDALETMRKAVQEMTENLLHEKEDQRIEKDPPLLPPPSEPPR